MPTTTEIRTIAARMYDDIRESGGTEHATQAANAFLDAIHRADQEWHQNMDAANLNFGGGSEVWKIVKRLATSQRDERYVEAFAVFSREEECV